MGLDEAEGIEVGGDHIVGGIFEVCKLSVGARLRVYFNCGHMAMN